MTRRAFFICIGCYFIGLAFGFGASWEKWVIADKYRRAMDKCEIILPRTMTCEVIGVPFQLQKIYIDPYTQRPAA